MFSLEIQLYFYMLMTSKASQSTEILTSSCSGPLFALLFGQKIQAAVAPNIMFVPLLRPPHNPQGNQQKMSVRTDEARGRLTRLLALDMLMLAGVPVTGNC